MKINGTDIKEYKTNFITTRLGVTVAALGIAGVVFSVLVAGGIIFSAVMWINFGFSTALPIMAAVPAFGLIFGLPALFLLREKKGMVQELKSRCKTEEEMAQITAMVKQKSKKSLIVILCIIALTVFIVLGMVLFETRDTNFSAAANTCGSCGRSWEAGDSGRDYRNIARTGLCKNCEDNYHDLEFALD